MKKWMRTLACLLLFSLLASCGGTAGTPTVYDLERACEALGAAVELDADRGTAMAAHQTAPVWQLRYEAYNSGHTARERYRLSVALANEEGSPGVEDAGYRAIYWRKTDGFFCYVCSGKCVMEAWGDRDAEQSIRSAFAAMGLRLPE